MKISESIRNARKKAGLTQKELGERLGVSAAMIAQYENGQRNPKNETIQKIATALDVPVSSLTNGIVTQVELVDPNEDDLRKEINDLTYSLKVKGLVKTRDYMNDLRFNPEYGKSASQRKPE